MMRQDARAIGAVYGLLAMLFLFLYLPLISISLWAWSLWSGARGVLFFSEYFLACVGLYGAYIWFSADLLGVYRKTRQRSSRAAILMLGVFGLSGIFLPLVFAPIWLSLVDRMKKLPVWTQTTFCVFPVIATGFSAVMYAF